jgi:lipoate-protein ligase A
LPPDASEISPPEMKYFECTFPSPAENLAGDEALLDWAESGAGGATLRFWESPEPFVVVGYANKVATEVNVAACEARKIPILRRCSGGGTVVQGPGCLNYTLVLPITKDGPLHSIAVANQFIMRRNRAAIESAVRSPQSTAPISICGHTDLALVTRHSSLVTMKKFSGNSQRRRKHFLLFHGTFLLNFDLALITELLRMPSKQPHYRENRTHADFLTNLNIPAERVKTALRQAWATDSQLTNPPLGETKALTREKYSTNEWNFKF